MILDAHERIGESWRQRWDSLRLFTPARYAGLPAAPFPAPPWSYPTKDEVADYVEDYAARFDLPVRTGVHVGGLSRQGDRYVVVTGERRLEATPVVVATGAFQTPRIPGFAGELDRDVVQFHSTDYCNPSQLQAGDVLVVGASNSGAEIALEASHDHQTWLSGRINGYLPVRLESLLYRLLGPVFWLALTRVLTVETAIGRRARPRFLSRGSPLFRVKPKDLAAAGVKRVPKTVGIQGGCPEVEDWRLLDVANVVWCTGFRPDFGWIDLPILGENGEPKYDRGVVESAPGLYFVGRRFLSAFASEMIGGVGRDADYIAECIASRPVSARPPPHRPT